MKKTLFDTFHSSYIVGSLVITILVLFLLKKYVKNQKYKNLALLFFGVVTVGLHISDLWVMFLSGKEAIVADNILFPIYFCNLAMILLLITAMIKNKSSKIFVNLAIVTSYTAILGAMISLFYPEYYTYADKMSCHVLKSFLSHSTMLIGALYLIVGGFFKVERKNTLVFSIGLLGFGVVGLVVNGIFLLAKLPNPNSMYLFAPPIAEVPFITWYTIPFVFISLVYSHTFVFERLSKRYYNKKIAIQQL